MAALTAALSALSLANTVQQYQSQRRAAGSVTRQADYEAQLYGTNADLADRQSEDAIARGHEAEMQQRGATRQLTGAQRAAYGAQGLDMSTGSPAQVIAGDEALGELDALTIRNNAMREAWGFKVQAANYRHQGTMTQMAAANQARELRRQANSTLISGAGSLFDVYNRFGSGSLGGGSGRPVKLRQYGTSNYPNGMFGK